MTCFHLMSSIKWQLSIHILTKNIMILHQIDNIDIEFKKLFNSNFLADIRFVISIVINNPKVQCSLLIFVLFLCVNLSCSQIAITNRVVVDYNKKVLTSNIQIRKYMNRINKRSKNLMKELSILTPLCSCDDYRRESVYKECKIFYFLLNRKLD